MSENKIAEIKRKISEFIKESEFYKYYLIFPDNFPEFLKEAQKLYNELISNYRYSDIYKAVEELQEEVRLAKKAIEKAVYKLILEAVRNGWVLLEKDIDGIHDTFWLGKGNKRICIYSWLTKRIYRIVLEVGNKEYEFIEYRTWIYRIDNKDSPQLIKSYDADNDLWEIAEKLLFSDESEIANFLSTIEA